MKFNKNTIKNNMLNFLYNNKTTDEFEKKIFLLGLIYYKKNKESFSSEIRLFGLPFIKKKYSCGKEKLYLFFIIIFVRNSRKIMYKEILHYIGNKYKNIYINFNCSGETYLFLSYIKPEKDSVFIATKQYHIELCNMMHPGIDCIYLPNIVKMRGIDNVYKEIYHSFKFYNILPFKHFIELENKLKKGEKVHYCREICKTMEIDYSSIAKFPIINEYVKNSVKNKMERIGLNINNFVLICPESQSNEKPVEGFWEKIIESFYNKGFDVFCNIITLNASYGTAKTCFLTFEEAYYLASMSKEIIGLRSGFIEYLTTLQNIPITCYYTKFKNRGVLPALDAEKVLNGFTLKLLPNVDVNNIKEIII